MDKIIIKLNKDVRAKVIDICNKFNNDPGELINVLHQTQDFLGYLPAEVQELIAECLHIPTAKVYGVVGKHFSEIVIQITLFCFAYGHL